MRIGKKPIVEEIADTSTDKNHIQRNILKRNKEEFGDDKNYKKIEKRVSFTKIVEVFSLLQNYIFGFNFINDLERY